VHQFEKVDFYQIFGRAMRRVTETWGRERVASKLIMMEA